MPTLKKWTFVHIWSNNPEINTNEQQTKPNKHQINTNKQQTKPNKHQINKNKQQTKPNKHQINTRHSLFEFILCLFGVYLGLICLCWALRHRTYKTFEIHMKIWNEYEHNMILYRNPVVCFRIMNILEHKSF